MKTLYYNINPDEDFLTDKIKENILAGKIFAFPTDTVYGLGCIYDNEQSAKLIYDIKGRDFNKPLVLYLSRVNEIKKYVKSFSIKLELFLKSFMPGGITVIIEKNELIPDFINSGLSSIGIRIVDNKFLLKLIDALGKPIIGTSANLSGQKSIKDGIHLMDLFNSKIDYIFDMGKSKLQLESTIIVYKENKIKLLRKGIIPFEKILATFKDIYD